jgi:hypothetical protein
MRKDLPRYDCDLEITNDEVNEVEKKPIDFEEVDPDLEDCREEMAELPLVTYDPDKHFVKWPT